MIENRSQDRPDSDLVKGVILQNRANFIAYNITRLRELIRYLPEEKLDLFHAVPVLVHVNSPGFAGYVDHPGTPCGIYRFLDSGFGDLAIKRLKIEGEGLGALVLKRAYIRGLYLMGSAGTLAQTDYSDFDYWVVVDRASLSEDQLALLRQKLRIIEVWGKETYDHDLKFFVVDIEQIRQNDFSGVDEEGTASGQKTILKEEFYRTFILMAGKIPYWAVLPADLDDSEYETWAATASLINDAEFVSDDYIDLGPLTSIRRQECLGAVLWQAWKAWRDPVKSLIKGSLIAYYYFFQEHEGVLCNIVKEGFSKRRLDSSLLDVYALVFDNAARFYDLMGDSHGCDLIKWCIYLRLRGYPIPMRLCRDSPKRRMLERYVKTWSWDEGRIQRMDSFRNWTEGEKLEFEKQILNKLAFLYQLIFRATGDPEPSLGLSPKDAAALKNRTAGHFKEKKGKIPRCSAYLRSVPDQGPLFVTSLETGSGEILWAVFDHMSPRHEDAGEALFSAVECLRVFGWIVANGLLGRAISLTTTHGVAINTLSARQIRLLLDEVVGFFPPANADVDRMSREPVWLRVFMALLPDSGKDEKGILSAECLLQNTWGEFFFNSIDLRHIQNHFHRCHEIAARVLQYSQGTIPGEFEYRIHLPGRDYEESAGKTIKGLIEALEKSGTAGKGGTVSSGETSPERGDRRSGPLLDLFRGDYE